MISENCPKCGAPCVIVDNIHKSTEWECGSKYWPTKNKNAYLVQSTRL